MCARSCVHVCARMSACPVRLVFIIGTMFIENVFFT